MKDFRPFTSRSGPAHVYLHSAVFLLSLMLSTVLLLVGCSPPEEKSESLEDYLTQSLAFYKRGELDRSLKMYNKALELDSKNARALFGRSVIYLQRPETYDDAIADATRAIELDPNLAKAYVSRASALVDMGHSEYAQLEIKGRVSSQADSAWALPPEERVERAIADATRAVELDPNLANAYFARAHAHMDIGRSELAIADFDRVLEIRPDLYVKVMAYAHRSQAYRNLGHLDSAIQDANKAIELQPNLAANFKMEPRLVTWHGFGPDAILATSYTNRGLAYDKEGRLDLSIGDYTFALEQDPEYIEAYVNRSNAYISVGLYEEALKDANKAIASSRHLAPALNARGMAYIGLGRTKDALADVTRAIEHDPTFAMAYSNRAYLYAGQSQYDDAIADATRAIELDPNLAEAYANRAEAYLFGDEYDKAITDSNAALRLDSTLVGTRVGRALAYLAKGEYSRALDDANRALIQNPSQIEAFYVRGSALLVLTEGKEGRDDLNSVIQLSMNPGLVELAKRALSLASK